MVNGPVQRLLGHSSIATTVRYMHLDDDDLADAVDRASPRTDSSVADQRVLHEDRQVHQRL
jgi:integrase